MIDFPLESYKFINTELTVVMASKSGFIAKQAQSASFLIWVEPKGTFKMHIDLQITKFYYTSKQSTEHNI